MIRKHPVYIFCNKDRKSFKKIDKTAYNNQNIIKKMSQRLYVPMCLDEFYFLCLPNWKKLANY